MPFYTEALQIGGGGGGGLSPTGSTTGATAQTQNFTTGLTVGTPTYVTATGNSSVAAGVTDGAGYTVTASGAGSFANGRAVNILAGTTAAITASGQGSFATGFAGSLFGTSNNITASGNGSFAGGFVESESSGNANIVASANGSFAWGATNGVQATAVGAIAFGSSFTNSLTNSFQVGFNSTSFLTVTRNQSGNLPGVVGINMGNTPPTAYLHIAASAGNPSQGPIKLTAGTNLATTEDGVFEYDGTHLYFTIGSTRHTLI